MSRAWRRLRAALAVPPSTPLPSPNQTTALRAVSFNKVEGLGDAKVRYAAGVDAVQALELAMRIVPTLLGALHKQHPNLRWADAARGDFGFSQP